VQAQLEKHRQAQVREEFAPASEAGKQLTADDVQPGDATPVQGRTIIKLQGHRKALRECQFPKDTFSAALIFGEHELPPAFTDWLRDEATVITWMGSAAPNLRKMPYPLVWNILNPIHTIESVPFQLTYLSGEVYCKNPPSTYAKQPQSVLNVPYKIGLPFSLVELCLTHTLEDSLVLCVGVDPTNIAMCNRSPVFVEPDAKRFNDWVESITAFYEGQIEGVEVEL